MDTRPRTSLISFCTVQLRTVCTAHSLAILCLCTTSGPDPRELPGFWGSMVFRHAPIPRKVSGNQQQQQQQFFFFFFWKESTFSDAGSDGTQPASCVDIPNRQSTYSCRCPMYGACQNDVFCGLFCSATLAIRCRRKAPFVHERQKTPNTSPQAVEPDP